MIPARRIFASALVVALLVFMPLRLVVGLGGGAVSARSVQGTVWGGQLSDASIGGQPVGDLSAGLSLFSLLTGQARLKVDGPLMHGAIVASFSSRGADIETLNLPLARAFGPVRLNAIDVSDTHIRFGNGRCNSAEGRVGLELGSILGSQKLSGTLKCSGPVLAVDLLSQSAMERLSLRFPDSGQYQARLAIRAVDADQAERLSAAGFRETPVGHIIKFSGAF